MGNASPVTVNPLPLMFNFEIVRLPGLLLVMVSYWFALLPTCTLPKLRLLGAAAREPPAKAGEQVRSTQTASAPNKSRDRVRARGIVIRTLLTNIPQQKRSRKFT